MGLLFFFSFYLWMVTCLLSLNGYMPQACNFVVATAPSNCAMGSCHLNNQTSETEYPYFKSLKTTARKCSNLQHPPSSSINQLSKSPTVKLATISRGVLQGTPDTLLGSENVWIWILVSRKKKNIDPTIQKFCRIWTAVPQEKKTSMKTKEPKWKRRAYLSKEAEAIQNHQGSSPWRALFPNLITFLP